MKNSKFDKNGQMYDITILDSTGQRHTIKFEDRLQFLKGLEIFKQSKEFKVTCHSNTDSTNK